MSIGSPRYSLELFGENADTECVKTLLTAGLLALTACAAPVAANTTAPIDPAGYVRFDTADEAEARRDVLIDTIWPDGMPAEAADLDLIEPAGERVGFAIVHAGHMGTPLDDLTAALVTAGFAVQTLAMPSDGRDVMTEYHDELFADQGTAAMAMMLDHIIETVNAFEALDPDALIVITGLSGGGWATHMAAAVDVRIDASFPVAGSLPLFARPFSPGSAGDAEQVWSAIYEDAATWLEIYALAAMPAGRRQVQILNLHDPCCFGGDAHEMYSGWLADTVQDWSIYIDTANTEHSISAQALRLITDMAASTHHADSRS